MEEAGARQEQIRESLQVSGSASPSDAEALRTITLVVGYVLFIPGLIALVFYLIWVGMGADIGPWEYPTYLWITYITGIISAVGAVMVGYLLVRIARKRIVYSVGDVLYPAAVVIGAYMVLVAVVRILNPIVLHYAILGDLYWASAIPNLFQLPYLIGGFLLIMIGKHRYPPRRPSEGSLYRA